MEIMNNKNLKNKTLYFHIYHFLKIFKIYFISNNNQTPLLSYN